MGGEEEEVREAVSMAAEECLSIGTKWILILFLVSTFLGTESLEAAKYFTTCVTA